MTINKDELYHQIALSFVQGIGAKMSTALIAYFGSAQEALGASIKQLTGVEGMGELKAKACKDAQIFVHATKELEFIEQKNITVLMRGNDNYPQRLLQCSDAPQVLYYKGTADLNTQKVIAVIGTRKNTEYGQRLCNDLLEGLAKEKDLIVVSGLAHGIDTIAHKASLKNNIETIGVLAHGLDSIYPVANKNLAKEMIECGGLLTEFCSNSGVDKGNFPARNRIVAGISDLTVVVESDIRGGAIITAYIANSYNKEVVAFPGRAYDNKSSGTNMLIRKNLASLITSSDDLLELMNWQKTKKEKVVQTQLLIHLTEEERMIADLLQQKDTVHADELLNNTGMNSSILASTLLQLEMQGLIKALPGKHYRIN
jgi:DNA processing protein